MCYCCATNPSIHHHCHCVAAVLLLLSHHGGVFVIMVLPLLLHHCSFIVAIAVSSSSLHHCGFVIAVTVSPLCQLWFCHCHCGVTFASVVVLSLPSQCCLCCHIVTVLSLQLHRCGAFAVTLSQFHCRH